jgi:Immunity protein Imm1
MPLRFHGTDRLCDPADIEEVIDLVRNRGSDYWNGNSGVSELAWRGAEGERRLWIFFLGEPGFHLVYYEPDGHRVAAIPAKPPAKPKWVDIPVGGDPKRISSGQAVSRREAEAILRRFAADGERDPGHCWEPVRWPEMP